MKHCCQDMDMHLESNEIYLSYCPIDRTYYIPYKKKMGGGYQVLLYCPWCGKHLPKELRNELFDILEQEYNLDISFLEIKKKAPKEFQSDEWWRKRGL